MKEWEKRLAMRAASTGSQFVECDFTIECDERGFSINCNVADGDDTFNEKMLPTMLLFYTRQLCKDLGQDFPSTIRGFLEATSLRATEAMLAPTGEA